ncbi:MAG: fumarate hydratase [Candidatus Altiarchaeota archaeon]
MTHPRMREELVELYRKAATDLPKDVEDALRKAREGEEGTAASILEGILENIRMARESSLPMCQDTGTPVFYVRKPCGISERELREEIIAATKTATELIPLRPNAVDTTTGRNSGDNTGSGIPVIHFDEGDVGEMTVELMLKGGGSENATLLYTLPDTRLEAGRDKNGIIKCVLDAVVRVQGKACSPNIIGVGIGGLADTSIELSKKQFLRRVDDENNDEGLGGMEEELLDKINTLGIGPMGLGGKTTALAVKAGKQHRHPASFFVAVSFMCWACRRHMMTIPVE